MTDLEQAREFIDNSGSARKASIFFNGWMEARGIDYRINRSTMSRIYRNEAKPAIIAFVCYVYSQELKHEP